MIQGAGCDKKIATPFLFFLLIPKRYERSEHSSAWLTPQTFIYSVLLRSVRFMRTSGYFNDFDGGESMSHLKIFFVTMAILCFVGSSINPRTGAQSNSVSENEFEFVGRIMNLPNTTGFIGDWTVGSRIVHVTTATGIDQEDGAVALGALGDAKGTLRADASVDGTRIDVKQAPPQCFDFRAIIQSFPNTAGFIGDWMVAGTVVHVTSATRINTEEGAVAVGKLVQIEGCRRVAGA